MLPQHFSQRRQHVRQRRSDLVWVPGQGSGQQRRFLEGTPRIPSLDQRHQHHRQRGLTVHGSAAPTLRGLQSVYSRLAGYDDVNDADTPHESAAKYSGICLDGKTLGCCRWLT